MKIRSIRHNAKIIIGDYQFSDSVKKEVFSLLARGVESISQNETNVKSTLHTPFRWEPDNIIFRNLKSYIIEEVEREFRPGARIDGSRVRLECMNFWAMVYKKGDYAQSHNHRPCSYSFAYFVKSKWYHPPLVFDDSGYKVRPKEGRFVVFPAYLNHHVPKNRFNEDRVTVSGNLIPNKDDLRVKKVGDS